MFTTKTGVFEGNLLLNLVLDTGWIPADVEDLTAEALKKEEVWSYASAASPLFTLTMAGDQTTRYHCGTYFRLDQASGSDKYFKILYSSYNESNDTTTVIIHGGGVYTLANETITNNVYSNSPTPWGLPNIFQPTESNIKGWNYLPLTAVYASGTTFNYPADLTGLLQKGYGIKFTQHGVEKFFYVVANPAYSSPNSLITLSPGNDSSGNVVAIENTTTYPITNLYWTDNPQAAIGFPGYFNWSPTYGTIGGLI
jgi:hypothetical protein